MKKMKWLLSCGSISIVSLVPMMSASCTSNKKDEEISPEKQAQLDRILPLMDRLIAIVEKYSPETKQYWDQIELAKEKMNVDVIKDLSLETLTKTVDFFERQVIQIEKTLKELNDVLNSNKDNDTTENAGSNSENNNETSVSEGTDNTNQPVSSEGTS